MKPKTRTFSVPSPGVPSCGQTPSSFHITSVAEVAGGPAVKLSDLTSTSLASTNCSSSPCPLLSTVSKGAETLSQFLISLFRSTWSQQSAGLSLSSTPLEEDEEDACPADCCCNFFSCKMHAATVCLLGTCQIVLSLRRVSLFFALSSISCSTCFITCMA